MKPAVVSLSFLLLLLFAFTTYLPLAFSDVEHVLDSRGIPLVPGRRYYILPSLFGAPGGGVKLGKTGNLTCPVTVLQQYSEVDNGRPVLFSILGISTGFIFTGTQLNISFAEKPNCAESSRWVVVNDDYPKAWVGIGGAEDLPNKKIPSGTFNIQRLNFGYHLKFCITGNADLCFNIGRYDDELGRRLILTNGDPFEVVFVSDPLSAGRSIA